MYEYGNNLLESPIKTYFDISLRLTNLTGLIIQVFPGFGETGRRVVTMHVLRIVTLRHIIVTPLTPTHSRFTAFCDDVTIIYAYQPSFSSGNGRMECLTPPPCIPPRQPRGIV